MNVSYTKNQQFFTGARADGGVVARQMAETYQTIRQQTINLTASLSVEDMAVQSMPEASPIKWHLAHTTWFFEKFVLSRFVKDYLPFHPAFTMLFSTDNGINLPREQRSLITRPSLTLVRSYRTHVDNAVMALIKNLPEEAVSVLEMGLQREQKNQELMLTDIKHLLGTNPFHPAYIVRPLEPAAKVATLKMLEPKLAVPLRIEFRTGTIAGLLEHMKQSGGAAYWNCADGGAALTSSFGGGFSMLADFWSGVSSAAALPARDLV